MSRIPHVKNSHKFYLPPSPYLVWPYKTAGPGTLDGIRTGLVARSVSAARSGSGTSLPWLRAPGVPAWSRSSHAKLIDIQLNETMRISSGTLQSTPNPWLPVLSTYSSSTSPTRRCNVQVAQQSGIQRSSTTFQWRYLSPNTSTSIKASCLGVNPTAEQLLQCQVGGVKIGSRLRWSTPHW